MNEKVVMASDFKQHCLRLLDQVANTRVRLQITKRGKPIALVIPIDDEGPVGMERSVKLLSDRDEDYLSTDEHWSADIL